LIADFHRQRASLCHSVPGGLCQIWLRLVEVIQLSVKVVISSAAKLDYENGILEQIDA
jgi:hypothetical protein